MLEHALVNHDGWKYALMNQGLLLQPSAKFRDVSWLPVGARSVDSLTGLPILNNEVRKVIIGEFSECIKNNGKWACINIDADQLKTANTKYGRAFGDEYINWEVAITTKAIEDAALSNTSTVRVVRPTHAADEAIVWFFNLSDDDMQKMQKLQESIGITVPIPELSFTFSLSTGLIKSDDLSIQKSLSETQKWLKAVPNRSAFDFFQMIEDKTEEQAKLEKISKDLYRLPLADLMKEQNISLLIEIMKNNLGGSRISAHLLELILKLQSIQTVRLLGNKVDRTTYISMLQTLGVEEADLNNVESPVALVNLFKKLFGGE